MKKKKSSHPQKLRWLNHGLSLVVAGLSLYILLTPLLPNFSFWWQKKIGTKPPLVLANEGEKNDRSDQPTEPVPSENTLVIPKILLQQQIYEGPNTGVLRKGIWHRPSTSTPNNGSNSVIVGHRFTYSNPNGPFYHLDKLKTGDDIVVYWNSQKYIYRVTEVKVVAPTEVEIEQKTSQSILTLYTCTPLWSAKDRLVVKAELEESP